MMKAKMKSTADKNFAVQQFLILGEKMQHLDISQVSMSTQDTRPLLAGGLVVELSV